MDDDVLQVETSVRGSLRLLELVENAAYVVLLVNVSLLVPSKRHLGMQRVQKSLGPSNTTVVLLSSDLIQSRLSDQVQKLRVQVVVALDGADSAIRESDEGTGGKSIFGGALVEVRLVVMREVEEERVRCRAIVRNDNARTCRTLAGGWRELFFAGQACAVHGA